MCSRAFCTALPCGSTTAFFGVMMILAFMSNGTVPRNVRIDGGESERRMLVFLRTEAEAVARLDTAPQTGGSEASISLAPFERIAGFQPAVFGMGDAIWMMNAFHQHHVPLSLYVLPPIWLTRGRGQSRRASGRKRSSSVAAHRRLPPALAPALPQPTSRFHLDRSGAPTPTGRLPEPVSLRSGQSGAGNHPRPLRRQSSGPGAARIVRPARQPGQLL